MVTLSMHYKKHCSPHKKGHEKVSRDDTDEYIDAFETQWFSGFVLEVDSVQPISLWKNEAHL